VSRELTLGARPLDGGCCAFRVWAPRAQQVAVHLLDPPDRLVPLAPEARGYHAAVVDDVLPGARYRYRLDDAEYPDPASRWQPEGVHGPSAVVDPTAFVWSDGGWGGVPLEALVLYELHVGTGTPAGTFTALIPTLDHLRRLGVTVLELMPVAQFPGRRNWGYDGVFPFAPAQAYGEPDDLRRLVDACHARGLALVLDVVYNHLGPEGNVLPHFGPYFTDRYRTPWGEAVNLDGPDSDEVRRFFVENALAWVREYHIDGFRLDAVHAFLDRAPYPFLEELADALHAEGARLGRPVHVIAEDERNDPRLVRPPALGGMGLDAVWSDDLHHALHALLTGERHGYYQDYGAPAHLARALACGYTYTGEYSAYRRRRHGRPPAGVEAHRFVVCLQNHDQVGNRAAGERLATLLPPDALRAAAAVVLLAPFLPLLVMGEEYGEVAPFLYFTEHGDPALAEAVRRGRRAEFAAFGWGEAVPDPQAEETFRRSCLQRERMGEPHHAALLAYYRTLLRLRRTHPALRRPALERQQVVLPGGSVLAVRRWAAEEESAPPGAGRRAEICLVVNLAPRPEQVTLALPGRWRRLLDAGEARWGGEGATAPDRLIGGEAVRLDLPPWACALYERE